MNLLVIGSGGRGNDLLLWLLGSWLLLRLRLLGLSLLLLLSSIGL